MDFKERTEKRRADTQSKKYAAAVSWALLSSTTLPDRLCFPLLLNFKLVDFTVKLPNGFHGFLDGSLELSTLALPALDLGHLIGLATSLGVNLLANLASLAVSNNAMD